MPPDPELSPDARRAAARTRDAVRAARARTGAFDVEVELPEPEAALPVAGLARALDEARTAGAALVPGGGWKGGAFPAAEPYVVSWQLARVAARQAGESARTALAPEGAPAQLRGPGAHGPAVGFSPWYVHSFAGRKGHARPDVAALVPASARHVLDVGCGEGALGAALGARGARVTGIEHDPAAAAVAASRLPRVLACRAEEAAQRLAERPDVVVLADVVEHLREPSRVLRALRDLLAPGGTLVFSLPNATHAAVLGGALGGRWDRELEGVVADDHRLYAGRAGWRALLVSCGFRVTALVPVPARTPSSEPDRAALLAATALGPDDLDAVQWLGTAEASARGGGETDGAVEDDAPLAAEDPVGAVAAEVAAGRARQEARNALRASALETLLAGGLVSGDDAAALLSGWTPAGLAERFEGSGLAPRLEGLSSVPLPATVGAAAAARRAAGLAVDEEALSATSFRVTFLPDG